VVLYNSVSVDGAIKDFELDIALHYQVAARFEAEVMLVGSDTAKSGIEMFMKTVPPERPIDCQKPVIKEDDPRGYWAIADSRGKLNGLLHVYRQMGYGKDVIVLVSEATPKNYLEYLTARQFDYIVAGSDHVDYRAALEELNRRYGFNTVATDTGGVLIAELLAADLVDEVQLLVSPEVVGEKAVNLFRAVKTPAKLEFAGCEAINNLVLLSYRVKKKKPKQ
jgi:2,5-diamino-6-(ribosylamino)-4(3H)-pyrimidinone 5'-phosphate reductase